MKSNHQARLLQTLEKRFAKHTNRHPGLSWAPVLARIQDNPAALKALAAMEESGGEPDVIAHDPASGRITFCDCSPESPSGRRSLCFDREALDSRKEHKPEGNAAEMAEAMGIQLLTEAQYHELQKLGDFDTKTSSWLATPGDLRSLGGALFGDRRYGRVFIYHNGAQSYYAARGFRGQVRV